MEKSLPKQIHHTAIIAENAKIGENCHIGPFCCVEDSAVIGRNVTLAGRIIVPQNTVIGDNVQLDTAAVLAMEGIKIEAQAKIGANAVINTPSVGQAAIVEAGSVVNSPVPPFAVVSGNPARIINYVGATDKTTVVMAENPAATASQCGAKLLNIPSFADLRGDLSVLELNAGFPFKVQRIFYTYNIATSQVRGEHAHKECHQFLVSVAGSVNVIVDNGVHREEYVLDNPATGLYIPPGVWATMYKHTADSVLLVLASHQYDNEDYIRDYNEFLTYKQC